MGLIICLALGGYLGLADVADGGGMSTQGEEKPCKTAESGGSGGVLVGGEPPCFWDHEQNEDPGVRSPNRQQGIAFSAGGSPGTANWSELGYFLANANCHEWVAGNSSRVGLTITMTGKVDDEGLQKVDHYDDWQSR